MGAVALKQGEGEVLASFLQAGLAPLSVPPSPSGSALLNLLLQWGHLAVPNLNPWYAPPAGARIGDSGRD